MPQDAMTDAQPSKTEAKLQPVYKNQSGSVEMSIWANQVKSQDGQDMTMHSITFKRNYRDKDGEWHKSDQYNRRDLGDLQALIVTAHQFLMKDPLA